MAKLASHTCILFINTAFVKEIQYYMFPAKVWCKKITFSLKHIELIINWDQYHHNSQKKKDVKNPAN